MKLEFYGLGSDLKKILYERFEEDEEIFYIFENASTYYEIKREYFKEGNSLFYNFRLFTEYDFYEKLLKTDKIVIREEKQAILFYNSLGSEVRKNLKIESYYEAIDVAYNFYSLFSEFQEYKVDIENIKIEEWQKEIFENLLKINRDIEKQIQLKGLVLPYMLRKKENMNELFTKKCKKICFINKVRFTPFEKEVLDVLENGGTVIENIIQMDRNDFDEKNLEIKKTFGIPSKEFFQEKGINFEIHQFDNKLTQLIGMVKKLEEKREEEDSVYRIYDAQEIDSRTGKDYQLLNQNRITYNLEETMQNTQIYRVLNLIYGILENTKTEKHQNNEKEYLFRMKDLYKGFKYEEFLNIFDLQGEYGVFQLLVHEGYKYISREILEKISPENKKFISEKLISFFYELEKLIEIDNMSDYGKYLENIFKRQRDAEDKIRDKYFEALSEMTVLEDFSFDHLWKGFFKGNISANLLKMFLKYLDKKAISLNLEEIDAQESEERYSINSFSAISDTKKRNIIFLNLQDSFPLVKVNNYLFSRGQRKKMGLPVSDDIKQVELFKFFNNIFGARNVYLSYVKNLEENISSAGIVEEIKLKYGIKNKNEGGEINEDGELLFIKKYFSQNGDKWEKKEIGPFIRSKLMKDKKRMSEEKLNLGYYSFEKLKEFEYGYYIEKMIGKTEKEEIEDKIDPLLFGNIIHSVYEKIVKENKESIESRDFYPDMEEIKKTLLSVLSGYEHKIPAEFIKFYKEVSFEEIAKSIKFFFQGLQSGEVKELEHVEKFEIYSEEKVRQKMERELENSGYKVSISGVMDLYIKAGLYSVLIDYKSGRLKDKSDINKALRQLDFYSVILGSGESISTGKYVVDTWSGDIRKDERDPQKNDTLSGEDVSTVIRNYFETDFYGLGERNSTFNHKKYKDIARRDDEDEISGK